jgi:hypothetical protein
MLDKRDAKNEPEFLLRFAGHRGESAAASLWRDKAQKRNLEENTRLG